MNAFGTDYDGVIINIEPQKAAAFGTIMNKEWGVNKDDAAQFWIAKGGTPRKYKFDYYYTKTYGEKLKDEDYRIIEGKFSEILKSRYYPKVTLEPYALELLQFARSNFDYTFISSGIPMEEVRYLVRLNGVVEYFNIVLGTNEKYPTKRDHFRKIISKCNPKQIIFVADGIEDMNIAKEFEITSIGIPSNHTVVSLYDAGATIVCPLSDSVETIMKLGISPKNSLP